MGLKSKAPKAPDYSKIAREQAGLAGQQWQQQLQASRPDQTSAFGGVDWAQDPTTGQWTQTTTLSPEYEALRSGQAAQQGQLGGAIGGMLGGLDTSQIDFSGAPALPGVSDYSGLGEIPGAVDYASLGEMPEVGGYNQQVIDTMRALRAPDLARRREAENTRLAAMGLGTGSGSAWESAQQALGDVENRSDLESILAGIQQGNVQFGQGMQRYGQGAQNLERQFQQAMAARQQGVGELGTQFEQGLRARQQGISDILGQRQANLGQLQGLFGLQGEQGLPQMPSFQTPGQPAGMTPDLLSAAQAKYQAKSANQGGGLLSGLTGLAGTVAGGFFGGPAGTAMGSAIGNKIGSWW